MTKKEIFINLVKKEIFDKADVYAKSYPDTFEDALDYFNGLQMSGDHTKVKFTDNGKLVLRFVQENKDAYNNLFKAKDIGDAIGVSSRTVSGAMRKLVTDGYVEKIGQDPTVYCITEAGIAVNLDEA